MTIDIPLAVVVGIFIVVVCVSSFMHGRIIKCVREHNDDDCEGANCDACGRKPNDPYCK